MNEEEHEEVHGDDEELMEGESDDDSQENEAANEVALVSFYSLQPSKFQVYIPGVSRPLKEDEEWEFDPEAYRLFHTFETKWPCLSFDTVIDTLGDNRSEFPLTCTLVAGTQAEDSRRNEIITMRLSNLYGIPHDKEDDESESDNDDDEETTQSAKSPRMHAAAIKHQGSINRIRVSHTTNLGDSRVCAAWNALGKVQLWNLSNALKEVNNMNDCASKSVVIKENPLFSYVGHKDEGYALAWSSLKTGALASGDNRGSISIWAMGEGGQWSINQRPLSGHTSSVEDLAWSPTEQSLLISCSSDRSVKLWDTRLGIYTIASPDSKACVCTVTDAHESDVNVLSWNKHDPLIVTGGDDATLKIWSLKTIQHHKGAITSVEWCPLESTTLLASGEDDQSTIWDLAVEAEIDQESNVSEVPPQLLFVHMGQHEIKEVHWHSQIPGLAITTALDGFNVFRTISV
ncbi:unnamed protein product [Anisakis simplex]|uniref:Glutamate-rich WD repeat-containing protein 1 n=1 Tax=Anisakis simplex TaxID=6269 RepID=A0A0M3K1S1_ANISI|nr:unnamed protein product [Anisakis simplex]